LFAHAVCQAQQDQLVEAKLARLEKELSSRGTQLQSSREELARAQSELDQTRSTLDRTQHAAQALKEGLEEEIRAEALLREAAERKAQTLQDKLDALCHTSESSASLSTPSKKLHKPHKPLQQAGGEQDSVVIASSMWSSAAKATKKVSLKKRQQEARAFLGAHEKTRQRLEAELEQCVLLEELDGAAALNVQLSDLVAQYNSSLELLQQTGAADVEEEAEGEGEEEEEEDGGDAVKQSIAGMEKSKISAAAAAGEAQAMSWARRREIFSTSDDGHRPKGVEGETDDAVAEEVQSKIAALEAALETAVDAGDLEACGKLNAQLQVLQGLLPPHRKAQEKSATRR
jgi:hypothetical protein